jgi:hypothetical protein
MPPCTAGANSSERIELTQIHLKSSGSREGRLALRYQSTTVPSLSMA